MPSTKADMPQRQAARNISKCWPLATSVSDALAFSSIVVDVNPKLHDYGVDNVDDNLFAK